MQRYLNRHLLHCAFYIINRLIQLVELGVPDITASRYTHKPLEDF